MKVAGQLYLNSTQFQLLENWSVQYVNSSKFSYNNKYNLVPIGSFLTRNKTAIDIKDGTEYKRVTIKINNGGVFLRDIAKGEQIGTKKQFVISKGQFLLSKIDARNGAFGVVPEIVDGAIITGNFWTFDVDYKKINPHFLALITTTPEFISFSEKASNGTTNRHYLQEDMFLKQNIPLPSLNEQKRIVEIYDRRIRSVKSGIDAIENLERKTQIYLFEKLGIREIKNIKLKNGLNAYNFSKLGLWGIDKILRGKEVDVLKS